MKRHVFLLITLIGMVLAGCAAPAVTPAPAPTATRVPATPLPTLAPAALDAALKAALTDAQVTRITSPDGQWTAETTSQICTNISGRSYTNSQIVLFDKDGKEIYHPVDELGPCQIDGVFFAGLGFSPNSRYFYYRASSVPKGAQCISAGSRPMVRLDLSTGKVTTLPEGFPSEDMSVMAWRDGSDLIVMDLNTAAEERFKEVFPSTTTFDLGWLPDNTTVVAVQNESDCAPFGKSSVVQIPVRTPGKARVVYTAEETSPLFLRYVGYTLNMYILADRDGAEWGLDPDTGKLVPLP